MKEYAFDVKLWAVCRVTASNEATARKKMLDVLDCIDVSYDNDGVKLTEASIEDESGETSELIEVDGEVE
jgi:hypothetical protein